jgi:hypothetical protein
MNFLSCMEKIKSICEDLENQWTEQEEIWESKSSHLLKNVRRFHILNRDLTEEMKNRDFTPLCDFIRKTAKEAHEKTNIFHMKKIDWMGKKVKSLELECKSIKQEIKQHRMQIVNWKSDCLNAFMDLRMRITSAQNDIRKVQANSNLKVNLWINSKSFNL